MLLMEVEQTRPIRAWRVGVCRKCKGKTWSVPFARKATGFGYFLTGKVEKRCDSCGYTVVGPAAVDPLKAYE